MRTKKLNNKGFTLVEVIVVAVIVAVLALVAIQLYTGYVNEARINTAENLAASATGYLQSAHNSVGDASIVNLIDGANPGGTTWQTTLNSTDVVSFTVPQNASVTVNTGTGVVTATVGGASSTGVYDYK